MIKTDYAEGYDDGLKGKRDHSERWAQDFGYKAASDYAAGYRKGADDLERISGAPRHV